MNLTIHLPQAITIALTFLGLCLNIRDHGKPKKGTENAWTTAIATVITYSLLIWGGFFR